MSVYCSVYWFREFSVNSKQYFLVDNSLKFSLPIHPAMHTIVWRIYFLRVYSSDQMFCVKTKILFICIHIKITQFFTCFISARELSSVENLSTSKLIQSFFCCCCFSYGACIKLQCTVISNFEYPILQLPACLPTL